MASELKQTNVKSIPWSNKCRRLANLVGNQAAKTPTTCFHSMRVASRILTRAPLSLARISSRHLSHSISRQSESMIFSSRTCTHRKISSAGQSQASSMRRARRKLWNAWMPAFLTLSVNRTLQTAPPSKKNVICRVSMSQRQWSLKRQSSAPNTSTTRILRLREPATTQCWKNQTVTITCSSTKPRNNENSALMLPANPATP